MFCPEGYVTLAEVHEAIDQFAWANTPTVKTKAIKSEGRIEEVPERERIAYKNWLFCAFLEIYSQDLRIALPTGLIVRTPPWVFDFVATSGGRGDWLGLGQYHTFPDNSEERLSIQPISIVLVSDEDFTVDCSKSGDASDKKILGSMDGLPVCIKLPPKIARSAEWAAEWPVMLKNIYSSQFTGDTAQRKSASGGRPDKVKQLALFYKIEFPSGHAGQSNKQVLETIRRNHRLIASQTTLQRVLRSIAAKGNSHQNLHQNLHQNP
jgi:hypothetical protein